MMAFSRHPECRGAAFNIYDIFFRRTQVGENTRTQIQKVYYSEHLRIWKQYSIDLSGASTIKPFEARINTASE
jgi:hypothetical protein